MAGSELQCQPGITAIVSFMDMSADKQAVNAGGKSPATEQLGNKALIFIALPQRAVVEGAGSTPGTIQQGDHCADHRAFPGRYRRCRIPATD